MAPSLQELIDFLLNEVALRGNQGATVPEVLKATEAFYGTPSQDGNQRHQTVDRRFKAKVWTWLTHHPEVSVGHENEWQDLSLDEVENLDQANPKSKDSEKSKADENSSASTAAQVRIFVSQERAWHAVAGHGPDLTKIPQSEFVLLSIIAAHKFTGVDQVDLVSLSGQDKRSVPKRTDSLQKKGYIEKRPIQRKSTRTSLCTHTKFLNSASDNSDHQKSQIATQTKSMIDFDAFTTQLFEILKKERIVSRNDLKKLLGFEDRWRWKILSRAIRKFERLGVVERVRAESQYEKLHPCIVLRREPTPKDIANFHEFNGAALDAIVDDQAEEDEDLEPDAVPRKSGDADGDVDMDTEKHVVASGPVVPSWTPERHITNQIFDIIDKSGTSGITNLDLNRFCFGSFYRRPSESLLHRLTDLWQLSQPVHLRHLAVVKDTDIQKTIIFFRNFSLRNFAERVKAGETSWEAVELSATNSKKKKLGIPGVEATVSRDNYGFPQTGPPKGLLKSGKASLYEGLVQAGPSDYNLTNHDPSVILLRNGEYAVKAGHIKATSGMVINTPIKAVQGSDVEMDDVPMEDSSRLSTKRQKASKSKHDKFKGLSRKERFEAMGMDATWTEYNALLMDRPGAGVYVTPQGKRRPAGKKQGRPRISRIAVFKSPKLFGLPWFVKEEGASDGEGDTSRAETSVVPGEPNDHQPASELDETMTPQTSRKRPQSEFDDIDSPTPLVDRPPPKRARGRPKKQPLPGQFKDISEPEISLSQSDATNAATEPRAAEMDENSSEADIKSKHLISPEDTQMPSTKRQRIASPDRVSSENVSSLPTPANPSTAEGQTTGTPLIVTTPAPEDNSVQGTPGEKKVQSKRAERGGGSVNLLRRKIVMDIVEKAGGAYPSGHEIWYPFVTEWIKLKFKEKPDLRTVKTAIKSLIDSGKLRQHTFSGLDASGVMVTKTIVTKPDISPDEVFVKKMQEKVLATDRAHPRVSYSPNIVLDPTISKHSSRASGLKQGLRVEQGATVRLQSKPASVLALERKKERQLERALYKRVVGVHDPYEDADLHIPGAVRLMQIKRPPLVEEFAPGSHTTQTIIFRPNVSRSLLNQKGERTKRFVKKISNIGPYALLMNAPQTFHPSSGTFATHSILGQIRKLPSKKPVADATGSIDDLSRLASASSAKHDFHRISDKISKWEIGHEHIFDAEYPETYISQTVRDSFQSAPIDGAIRFDVDEPEPAPRPVITPMKTRKRTERRRLRQGERRLETVDTSTGIQPRARPQQVVDGVARPLKRRTYQPIPETLLRKIMIAIVAVRVLTGGTEARHVDWDLVAACFPGHDAASLIERARNVLGRNRLQMFKMQHDFQDRFLEAYARDEVPPIDYTNVESYAWPALIEWANFHLEVSTSERAPSLPATREQFDSMFELREEPIPTADEIFTTTAGMTVAHRRGVMAQMPFVTMLNGGDSRAKQTARQKELNWEEVTKSYVRANIVTPEETYDSAKSKTILERFGDRRIQSAVESLVRDRVIGLSNHGRVMPGRNYDITDHLLQQLNRKRLIECGILKNAAQFKVSTLDQTLRDGTTEVQYNAEDGDILAIINLFANGQLALYPRGAPRDKFGLVDDGYLTRQMDKTKLRFAIEVQPTKSYIYGNPMQERAGSIKPPSLSQPQEGMPQKIPLWMDLNGHLVKPLWEMSIASVLGCLALREGISATGISSMTKPAMAAWEIEAMLGWLADTGIVERVGSGLKTRWRVAEWWWMALP